MIGCWVVVVCEVVECWLLLPLLPDEDDDDFLVFDLDDGEDDMDFEADDVDVLGFIWNGNKTLSKIYRIYRYKIENKNGPIPQPARRKHFISPPTQVNTIEKLL